MQEAFCGLYRQWGRLDGADGAMYYVRASVLNGCRSVLRHRAVRRRGLAEQPSAVSAEAVVLGGEEREEVIRALVGLPHRQREVLMLRYYCDLSDEQIARVMSIGQSTLAQLASMWPVSIVTFGDLAPGASPGIPLRDAYLAQASGGAGAGPAAQARQMSDFVHGLRGFYSSARIQTVHLAGHNVLRIEFTAPSVLGLLKPSTP